MKKILLSIITSVILTAAATALPGFTPYIQDSPGEYVYYRDFSFERESYIGILEYDEQTYQIRYYAPKTASPARTEKSVAALFSVNPGEQAFNMTGERILTTVLPDTEDVDILNYLHDFLYELSARRIRTDNVTPASEFYKLSDNFWEAGYKAQADIDIFGGKISITYDCTIPFFNVKSITAADGTEIIKCATTGAIRNSGDTSFDSFRGFSPRAAAQPQKGRAKTKSPKSKKFSTQDGQTVTLDEDWTQKMENFWTYGNDATLTLTAIPSFLEDEIETRIYSIRKLLQGSGGVYPDFSTAEVLYGKNGQIKISKTDISQESQSYIRNTKILTPKSDGGFFYFALSVYADSYEAKSSYYEKILKSYRLK